MTALAIFFAFHFGKIFYIYFHKFFPFWCIFTVRLETISCKIADAILKLLQIRSGAAEGGGWGEEFRRTLAWKKLSPPH